jgi:hypothetical protein
MERVEHQAEEKPTLLDLREKHSVTVIQLAETSGVAPSIVYCMLLDRPVDRSHASQVLTGLSKLVGTEYSFDTVHVNSIQ